MGQFQFVKTLLYKLKRLYGKPIKLVKEIIGSSNFATGNKNKTVTEYVIYRCIRLPESYASIAEIGIFFKHIKNQGEFQRGLRAFIIDAKDIPKGVKPDENWQIHMEQDVYTVQDVDVFENNLAFIITAVRRN